MAKSPLSDAFDHHVWATLRLIDACLELSTEQLETTLPGTYGSIIETFRHLVGADRGYLALFNDGETPEIEEDGMDLAQLREVIVADGPAWQALLATSPDPERELVRHRDDGTDSHSPIGIRLAQVIHHGTDHRSQVCTALTSLGIEPPEIDVWDYGRDDGRVFVTDASGSRISE